MCLAMYFVNVFGVYTELVSLVSGDVATDQIATDLLNSVTNGKTKVLQIIAERLASEEGDFHAVLKSTTL